VKDRVKLLSMVTNQHCLVLFKTFTKWIQVTLNVIGLMVWWKMHYSTIYCTQLINFILILIFNWFFSNAQFLFNGSGLIRGEASLQGVNLVVFYYFSASEVWL
jgi:hypothetical protein